MTICRWTPTALTPKMLFSFILLAQLPPASCQLLCIVILFISVSFSCIVSACAFLVEAPSSCAQQKVQCSQALHEVAHTRRTKMASLGLNMKLVLGRVQILWYTAAHNPLLPWEAALSMPPCFCPSSRAVKLLSRRPGLYICILSVTLWAGGKPPKQYRRPMRTALAQT